MPRYYRDDSREVGEFIGWSIVLAGQGLTALWNAIRPRPEMYYPKAPDDPTQVPVLERFLKGNTIDLSKAKLPKIDLSGFKSVKDLKQVKVEWKPEDRPQLVKAEENPYPFLLPIGSEGATVIRIYPVQQEANHDTAVKLMQAILASCPKLSFEIVSDGHGTYWQLVDLENSYPPDVLSMHMQAHYPSSRVEILTNQPQQRQYPFYRQMALFGLSNEYAAPLPFFSAAKLSQLVTMTNRMELLSADHDERIAYRLITYTRTIEAENRAGHRLSEGMVKPTSGLWKKTDPFFGMDDKLLNAKLDMPQYHAFLTLTVESREEGRLPTLIQSAKDLTAIAQPRHNGIITVGNQSLKHVIETPDEAQLLWFETLLTALVRRRADEWRKLLIVASPEELANLWHLPDARFTAQRIMWNKGGVSADLTTKSEQAVYIGDTTIGGRTSPIYVTPDERINHTLILGKTGVGKSTLMHAQIHQDIAAGRGVAVIDPQGSLISAILCQSIPENRVQDVVLLQCGNIDYPVPLNPFRVPAGTSYAYANTYLYWVIRRIYDDIWREGRMDFTMRNVIQALLTDPEATPLDISRLFTNDRYREKVVERLYEHEDVSIAMTEYWQEFGNKSKGDKNELAQPIINRTGAFVGNRALELMTCHPNTLNFKELIAGNKIVLINLAGEEIKTEATSLGSIFLAHFYLASQSLGVLPNGVPPRMYLFIDEADRYVASPLPDMFAEARKYGLALTLATQFLSRLPKDTQEGIFGNVGTQYLFELGLDDAKGLEPYIKPELTHRDLLNLGKYRMIVKTRAKGNTQPAFTVTTKEVPTGENTSYTVSEPSADYGFLPKAEVSKWLKKRYAPPPKPKSDEAKETQSKAETSTSSDGLGDYE